MIPSRYQLYMDIAGRVSESIDGYEYVTVGGICILPETIDTLRSQCSNLPKWRDSKLDNALAAVDILGSYVLAALCVRMQKSQPRWRDFWKDGKSHHQSTAQRAENARETAFLKPGTTIKYFLFGECSARLAGELVRSIGRPSIKNSEGLSIVQLNVVCDSDIQGTENIRILKELFENSTNNQPRIRSLGIRLQVTNVRLQTEQEEPILNLADHLAGATHTIMNPVTPPAAIKGADLGKISDAYGSLSNVTTIDKEFDLQHQDIYLKNF